MLALGSTMALAPAATPLSEERPVESLFPIVGVGASAGGLEALSQLLTHLPDDTGMAFVLVQHLDPKHESRLRELLAKNTSMPVLEATQGLAVAPDHVYIIPPNTKMSLAGGCLHLAPRGASPLLPIDQFSQSLAEERAAGVRGRAPAVGSAGGGGGRGGGGRCGPPHDGLLPPPSNTPPAPPKGAARSGC